MLPIGFTYLEDPRIILSLDYFTHHNFIGRPIAGYLTPLCILTKETAKALTAVQDELDSLHPGHQLKIFDAYRPVAACLDFKQWAMDPAHQEMKANFYPDIPKSELFNLGYIAEKSSHCRGSTVDLTITVKETKETPGGEVIFFQDLDMGTPFDFFGEKSHTAYPTLSDKAKKNRAFLKNIMEKHGFENYPLEWWHFTLKREPFPNTYFDFTIQEHI